MTPVSASPLLPFPGSGSHENAIPRSCVHLALRVSCEQQPGPTASWAVLFRGNEVAFLCQEAPAPGRAGGSPELQGSPEINTESCAWSGYRRGSVAAPHPQTAPPGYKEQRKKNEMTRLRDWNSSPQASLGELTSGHCLPTPPTRLPFNSVSFLLGLRKT